MEDLVIIEGHNSSHHDGGVAVYIDENILALAAERVDKIKHSMNSEAAYSFLTKRLDFGGKRVYDYFDRVYKPFQEINHPLAHAASAYYPSGFNEAIVLVVDGQGAYKNNKLVSTSVWLAHEGGIEPVEVVEEDGPFCDNSIGHFYSAVTYFLGFEFYDQGKTMALAAYGQPSKYLDILRKFCAAHMDAFLDTDQNFIRTQFYLSHGEDFGWEPPSNLSRLKRRYGQLLGPRRKKKEPITQKHKDIAWAAQKITEDILVRKCSSLYDRYRIKNLCIAGGVGLNVVANNEILRRTDFENVFVQPAAGDDGQALGKLLYRMHNEFKLPRWAMRNAYLGPVYTAEEIEAALRVHSDHLVISEGLDEDSLLDETATALDEGQVVGWYQNGSEFGPRALGHRSILADPRRLEMKDRINSQVKHREGFQPCAASMSLESVNDYYDLPVESPYMLLIGIARQKAKEAVPAVIHVDNATRIQTVTDKTDRLFYRLIKKFGEKSGVEIVLNTSFNDRGQPIVETPNDAIQSFLKMDLDLLVLDSYLIRKRTGTE